MMKEGRIILERGRARYRLRITRLNVPLDAVLFRHNIFAQAQVDYER